MIGVLGWVVPDRRAALSLASDPDVAESSWAVHVRGMSPILIVGIRRLLAPVNPAAWHAVADLAGVRPVAGILAAAGIASRRRGRCLLSLTRRRVVVRGRL